MSHWQPLEDALNGTVIGAFGRDIRYLPRLGGEVTVRSIFEHTRESQDSAPGVYAALFLRLKDLPQPPERGDVVSIDDRDYKVFDIEADGGGGALIRLRQI